MFEMTAVKNKLSSNQKIEFIQAQKKLLLTSRVGELVGPTVGLDDGCSKDREREIISCVSNCDVEVSSKSQEIESTNNRSSLPPLTVSLLANQWATRKDSLTAIQ